MTSKDCLDEKKAGFNNSNGPTGYVTLHTCCKTALQLAKHDILSHF